MTPQDLNNGNALLQLTAIGARLKLYLRSRIFIPHAMGLSAMTKNYSPAFELFFRVRTAAGKLLTNAYTFTHVCDDSVSIRERGLCMKN